MKTIITSKNCFYRELKSLCEEIGKKCLNGEEVNLDEEKWYVLDNGKNKKIRFEISYCKPDSEQTNIVLIIYFDEWKWKPICISIRHTEQFSEEGYELQTVEYSIDNVFYSTTYLNGECKTEKKMFF